MPSAPIKGTDLRVYATYCSRSSPNKRYTVLVDKNDVPQFCNCPGWQYNRKCWHMEKARTNILKSKGVE